LIVRKILYPLYRALKRDTVLARLQDMRKVQHMDPDQIRQYQWNKVRLLLEHAAEHVPYYRKVFKDIGAEPGDFKGEADLGRMPILRKRNIRENTDAMISEAFSKKDLAPDSTGGSTGENLYFWVDRQASQARTANNIRMNEWIDIRIGDRIALLWGTAFDMKQSRRLVNALRNMVQNTLILSAYRMDSENVAAYAERLSRFKPHMLVAYPSALAHFSQGLLDTGRAEIRPKAVLLSGETVYDWQREITERAFATAAYSHYGSREFGGLARECRLRNGLHIGCERVLVEAVPVTDGPAGTDMRELVISDLDNYGMPFIRYAIEDLGTITWDKCDCGINLPRLETTIGRTFDVVRAPNGNFLGGTFWTILLRKMKGIERFQVIQEVIDEITIALIPTAEFSDQTRTYIIGKVREACGDQMRVRFEIKPELQQTPAGKHRFVISRLGLTGGEGDGPSQG
jgi:phenylacetate-CoA ligase